MVGMNMLDKKYMAGPWITDHEINVVNDCMQNGWYNYDYVEKFQKEFAEYHGRRYGIMTPNCTTAIHLLLTALGIKDGDEVIVPDMTWIGSTAGISYLRAKPVFCDIDPINWCIDPKSVEYVITPRTKAVIAVDLFGNMPDMTRLKQICDNHGIYLIEDAAEAIGSRYYGVRAGKFGIGSAFSFHRTKTITTGEGGMILLDDDALYERCMFLRDHGRKPGGQMYYNYEVTYKYMPSNLQAAMGYAQFQRIDELVGKKRFIFETNKKYLADIPDIQLNYESKDIINGVWITGLVFGKGHKMEKIDAITKLEKMGYPARPFFYPLSSLPAYPDCREIYESKNPHAYDISKRGINLPSALILQEEQIKEYCNAIHRLLGR